MRDEDRIDRILGKIGTHWHRYPDQRFWQILFNASGYLYNEENMTVKDPYYIEDDELERVLDEFFAGDGED